MKNNKGITLIALIITILVMLILAGVAISMVIGEDGVINQAQNATIENLRVEIIEAAQLAYSGANIKNYENSDKSVIPNLVVDELKNNGYDIKDITTTTTTISEINLSKNKLDFKMKDAGSAINITYNEGNTIKTNYYASIEGKYYELTINSNKIELSETSTDINSLQTNIADEIEIISSDTNNEIIDISKTGNTLMITPKKIGTATITIRIKNKPELQQICTINVEEVTFSASQITSLDYGKEVTNYTVSGYTGKWQILYADNENIYLITKNVVNDPIYNNTSPYKAVKSNEYSQGNILLSDSIKYPAAAKWLSEYIKVKDTLKSSDGEAIQATLFMLDSTGVWNNVYRNEAYADYAIGSPTAEMIIESYNSGKTSGKKGLRIGNGYGYYFDNNAYHSMPSNSVWIVSNSSSNSYWISSPSGTSYNVLVFMNAYNEYIDDISYNNGYGYRPVVCLKNTVSLVSDSINADGITTSYKIK